MPSAGPLGRGRLLASAGVAGEQLDDLLPDSVEIGAQLHQDLGGDALALANEAEQDVLGADVVVAELEGLSERKLQDLLRPRSEGDVAGRGLLPLTDDLLNLLANSLERNPEALQGLSGDTLTLVDQAQEDVLGADVVVVEHPGFFLSQDDNPPRAVGEPLEHRLSLLRAVGQFGVGPRPVLPHASPAGRDSSFQLPTSVRGSPPRPWGKPASTADNCSNPMVRDDVPAGQADTRHTCTPMANGSCPKQRVAPIH